jgi:hypothetical protein
MLDMVIFYGRSIKIFMLVCQNVENWTYNVHLKNKRNNVNVHFFFKWQFWNFCGMSKIDIVQEHICTHLKYIHQRKTTEWIKY